MNPDTPDRAAPPPHAGSENCLPIGTRLSDFEVTGVLGEGGFGIVYVAYDHALQRTVAIKEYMPGVLAMRANDQSITLRGERHKETFRVGLKSFINEARFLAQFDHPALVKVYRFWEQNNTAYTAMKFYDGRTIKDIVTNSPELVNEVWCRKVLRQILQALEMLYTMQILHRDISPDNIIVQENGDAVLLDFGSARQIIGDMTRGLTVILKPGYAPVEQYAGDASLEQGPFTDLYSLAAVMYFAITKKPPPTSIGRMINDPIVALTKQAPEGYSASLLAAIDKGLVVLAHDRPQTIQEFRDLLGIVSLEPPPVRPAAALAPAAPPARAIDPAATATKTPVAIADAKLQPAPVANPDLKLQPAPLGKPVGAQAAVKSGGMQASAGPAVKPLAKLAGSPFGGRRRLLFGAGAVSLVAIAAAGLYALVQSSSEDTFMLAMPQSRPGVLAPAAGSPTPTPLSGASTPGLESTASMVAGSAATPADGASATSAGASSTTTAVASPVPVASAAAVATPVPVAGTAAVASPVPVANAAVARPVPVPGAAMTPATAAVTSASNSAGKALDRGETLMASTPRGLTPASIPAGTPSVANTPILASTPAIAGAETAANAAAPAVPPKPEVKRAPPALVSANYKLQIKPWGTLYVDGKARGVSPPLKQLALTPGKHKIRVVNPSFPEYSTTIDIDKSKPGTIEHDFSAAR